MNGSIHSYYAVISIEMCLPGLCVFMFHKGSGLNTSPSASRWRCQCDSVVLSLFLPAPYLSLLRNDTDANCQGWYPCHLPLTSRVRDAHVTPSLGTSVLHRSSGILTYWAPSSFNLASEDQPEERLILTSLDTSPERSNKNRDFGLFFNANRTTFCSIY